MPPHFLPPLRSFLLITVFFLVIFFLTAYWDLPIHISLFLGFLLIVLAGIAHGVSLSEMELSSARAVQKSFPVLFLFLPIGGLIGTWNVAGIVPAFIYYGLDVLSADYFVPVAFVLASCVSLLTGTSWGTVGTVGIALSAIGATLQINPALTAGAVICGALFGDKLSPLSDTTVMAASAVHTPILRHVRGMLPVTIPAFAVSLALFAFYGAHHGHAVPFTTEVATVQNLLKTQFVLTPWLLVPPFVVFGMMLFRFSALAALSAGLILAIFFGHFIQSVPWPTMISALMQPAPKAIADPILAVILNQGGFVFMFDSLIAALIALSITGVLYHLGVLHQVSEKALQWSRTPLQLSLVSLTGGTLLSATTGSPHATLIILGRLLSAKTDSLKLSRSFLSQSLETASTLIIVAFPWSPTALFMGPLLGVNPAAFLPYLFFTWASLVFSVVLAPFWKRFWPQKPEDFAAQKPLGEQESFARQL